MPLREALELFHHECPWYKFVSLAKGHVVMCGCLVLCGQSRQDMETAVRVFIFQNNLQCL